MWVTSSLTTVLTPTVVALGNFDGVHRGHQQVVKPVLPYSEAEIVKNHVASLPRSSRWINDDGIWVDKTSETWEFLSKGETAGYPYTTVVTFNPHPREFFSGQPRALLTPLDEKVVQMRRLGVEQLILLPFDRELADLSPQQFVEEILVRQLKSRRISVGKDFRFGCKRAGTAEDLQAIAAKFAVEVFIVPLQIYEGERVSSSAIRQAIQEGNIQKANKLLGRSYSLVGTVVQGQQLGRTLGFPTANLHLPPEKFLPRQGVYAVQVFIGEESKTTPIEKPNSPETETTIQPYINSLPTVTSSDPFPAVMNIGNRPTMNGIHTTVEVHLLDWSGDLYGKTLTVNLIQYLRPEQKFTSLEALKAQIQADCETAKSVLN